MPVRKEDLDVRVVADILFYSEDIPFQGRMPYLVVLYSIHVRFFVQINKIIQSVPAPKSRLPSRCQGSYLDHHLVATSTP